MDRPNAHLTTDVVVLAQHPDSRLWHVLLIERGHAPFKHRRGLPGGFVEPDEQPADAARRELAEETGVVVDADTLIEVGTYAAPHRDPRGRVVSVAYLHLTASMTTPRAGDDAAAADWVLVPTALDTQLAFDHHLILRAALARADYPPFF